MSITIEMTAQEIAALKQVTKLESESDAVLQATREFLRLRLLWELKAVCGKVELDADWQGLEKLELDEAGFPH